MEFSEMQQQVYEWAESKSWNDPAIVDPTEYPSPIEYKLALIALIHMSLSNELELIRKGQPPSDRLEKMAAHTSFPNLDALALLRKESSGLFEGANVIKILAKLALVHSEVSEAVDAVLKGKIKPSIVDGKPEGLGSEIADTHIRLLHLSAMLGQDSAKDFATKMEFNNTRPTKHGKLA